MHSPLTNMPEIPVGDHPGAFGVKRKHHTHEGVDLYCDEDTQVFAMDDGIVVWKGWFTGQYANSPWWHNTEAVAIQHSWGIMFYGEIISHGSLEYGFQIRAGEMVGWVKRVLKNDKGTPTSMLHLELYEKMPRLLPPPLWTDEKPKGLLDPTFKIMGF